MKIRVAVLDNDQVYLDRFVSAFSAKYAEKVELYSFSDQKLALSTLTANRIDVFIASETFDISADSIPERCVFAYFVDTAGIDSYNNQSAICKFQKADLIYKQLLSLYSEKAPIISSLNSDEASARIIMFTSPVGGVGTSTVAASCAKHFAAKGNRVLYLCLEPFGSADCFFSGEGQFDLSEVIYALKSRKTNLSMKLESSVRQDASGVYFYSATSVPLDMLELTNDDIVRLINELKLTGSYNFIIIDLGFGLDKDHLKLYGLANSIVSVSDGEGISNYKIARAFNSFVLLEQSKNVDLLKYHALVYNRFSSKTGKYAEGIDIKVIGGTQVFVHNDARQVVDQISNMGMFDNIIGGL